MRQSAGSHTMSNNLYVGTYGSGTGCYELAGTGASLTTPNLFLGNQGVGAFEQSAGTCNVPGKLHLGLFAGGEGSYRLSGGTLQVASCAYIGRGGEGVFVQSGGNSDIASLCIGEQRGGNGTVNIHGGNALVRGNAYRTWVALPRAPAASACSRSTRAVNSTSAAGA